MNNQKNVIPKQKEPTHEQICSIYENLVKIYAKWKYDVEIKNVTFTTKNPLDMSGNR